METQYVDKKPQRIYIITDLVYFLAKHNLQKRCHQSRTFLSYLDGCALLFSRISRLTFLRNSNQEKSEKS